MAKSALSVIIPTLNEEHFLPKLLNSLSIQTDKQFEVIVVDAGSQDKTVSVAKKYTKILPKITILENISGGVSRQRNRGAKHANSDVLLFLDADSVLPPYSVKRLKELLRMYPVDHFTAWASPDSEKVNDAILCLLFNLTYEMGIMTKRPVAIGAFTGITRSVFEKIGGFDEERQFGEDSDLTKRIHDTGGTFAIYRETLYVYSLRRFRKQGIAKTIQHSAKVVLQMLINKQTAKILPEYVMGGHLYAPEKNDV